MRIPRLAVAFALALAALTACVSRVGPSVAQLPARSPVSGECGADDVEVRGGPHDEPSITVPAGCAAPTRLLARDVVRGDGRQARVGATLMVNYVMFAWSDGGELDSTWAGRDETPFEVADLGHAKVIQAWNEALPGIREGGRRLIVVPPDHGTGDGATEPLVYVVDAVAVS